MSKHENIKELLAAFTLGDLSQQQEAEIQTHLAECPQCSNELKRFEALLECTEHIHKMSADTQMSESAKRAIFAAVESEKTKHTFRPNIDPVFIWRKIMKSPVTKLAAAAIVIAALIVINQLGIPFDVTNVAWADVQKAFLAQSWVHLKYDNGTESWYNLKNGDHCHIQLYHPGKRFVYINRVENLRQVYVPYHGQHMQEDRPVIYKDNIILPYEPKTAWEAIVGHLGIVSENVKSGDWEFEKNSEKVDGKQLVRFDRYYNDAAERRLLVKQIWADPETRLPVRVWERLSLAQRKAQNREHITGTFSFPETGPLSIYDLGVPKDLPVVRNYDKIPETSVTEVVEAGKAALEKFPSRYRTIRWENDNESEIELIWQDGKKIHHNHYFNLSAERYPEHHLELPADAEKVLNWTKNQTPVSIYIFDTQRQYSRHNPPPFNDTREPEARVMRTRTDLLPSSSKTIEDQWSYATRNLSSFERIEDVPNELNKYIGLRISSGDIRRDFYIDPEHDYIYARWIWWKQRSGTWEKVREYENSDFTQLPEGQWYAKRRVLITYPDPERGTGRGGADWNIDVKLLKEDEFPPDTFNGEKLLEGAKIETY